MPFRNDGEGLHRSVDPADGKHYVYGMSFMDAAPTIFACFDQPDLKAPYTFHVRAPQDWVVDRQRTRPAGREGRLGVRAEPAPVDVLRDARGRSLPRDPRRARRHPARPQRPGQHRGRPRQGRRRAVHADQAELRRAAPAVRHPLPVRRLPPGVRARVQRRRDGEPGLRHLPRPARLHQPGDPRRPDRPGQHARARDGAPVVRQPRHPGVVGRPVAQRVVRRVHGQPGHRRRHRVRRRVGRQRLRAAPVGAGRRPAAEHPPGRRQRRGRRQRGAAGLRRDLLRQGLRDPAPAQRHARRRGVLQGRHRPLRAAPLRQRHDARPLRELGARRRRRPVELHRQLAAHRRPGPDRARPRGRRGPPYAARGPPRRPAAPHPRGRRVGGRHVDRPRAGARGPGDAVRRRRPAGAARPLQRHLGAARSPTS